MSDILDMPNPKRPPLRLEKLPEPQANSAKQLALKKADELLAHLDSVMERLRQRRVEVVDMRYDIIRGALSPTDAIELLK